MKDESYSDEELNIISHNMLRVSSIVYSFMITVGVMIAIFLHKNTDVSLGIPLAEDLVFILEVAGLSTGVLLISSYLFESFFDSFISIKLFLIDILGPGPIWAGVYLALISAFGEEIFFRAAIQPYLGLTLTSLLFGLLHLDKNGKISSWSIWSIGAGFLLGAMVNVTASLWPAVITHFAVNCFSIMNCKYIFRKRQKIDELNGL